MLRNAFESSSAGKALIQRDNTFKLVKGIVFE